MKIYWSLKSIRELAEMSEKDRKIIWRRCYQKASRNWQTRVALVVWGGCAGLGAVLGSIWGGVPDGVIGAYVGSGVGGFIWAEVAINKTVPYIREELNSRRQVGGTNDKK